MKVTFLGATGTVTGSKYLLEHHGKKIMVDCGLFQGLKDLRLRNWDAFPINPKEIDALLLTHAHLDHSGYIPKLVQLGFKGPIYCSESTYELCKILLADSGHIHEEDARRANLYGYTKHKPALPFYTEEEARDTFKYFKPVEFSQPTPLFEELSFTLHRAGHILGASFIRLKDEAEGKSIIFSGDIGRTGDPVMVDPSKMNDTDYLFVESTYGDRLHIKDDPADDMERIIRQTIMRGGTVVIPSFAVGRAQKMMYYIYQLKKEKRLPQNLTIYLDSPMAINASALLCKHPKDHRMSPQLCKDVCKIAEYTRTVEQSKNIYNKSNNMPKVIISASGMATGGRVLHHLKNYLGDARNTILFSGFQAAGTRGAVLVDGKREIKIHGEFWPVKAQIEKLDNLSAHADYQEILSWMRHFKVFRKVFVVHGEIEASESLKEKIESEFGFKAEIPVYKQSETLW